METQPRIKKLVKILIGAAWLDGKVQPEEQKYLQRVAQDKGIAEDPELRPWLYDLRPVSPEDCYAWVQEYLGNHPTSEDCYQLIEAISALIYSDGDVANEEAKLLQHLDSAQTEPRQFYTSVIQAIQKLYQRSRD